MFRVLSLSQPPVFNENPASREVAENALEGDYVGAPIVATAGVTDIRYPRQDRRRRLLCDR